MPQRNPLGKRALSISAVATAPATCSGEEELAARPRLASSALVPAKSEFLMKFRRSISAQAPQAVVREAIVARYFTNVSPCGTAYLKT